MRNHLESIEIPNKRDINPNTFSISFWVKSIQNPEPNGDILSHVDADSTSGWYFNSFKIQNSSDQSLRFVVPNKEGTHFFTKEVHISSDKFSHIVGTFDGSYLSIYENGVLGGKTKFLGTSYTISKSTPENWRGSLWLTKSYVVWNYR